MTIEAVVPLTFSRKTSRRAHELLEKILNSYIDKYEIIDYGLSLKPGIELKIANTEHGAFLLQSELDSINRGY